MEKRNVCRMATILCAVFAIAISIRVDMVTWQWQDDKPMGIALGLLSAIFATQWYHYQKRQNETTASHTDAIRLGELSAPKSTGVDMR